MLKSRVVEVKFSLSGYADARTWLEVTRQVRRNATGGHDYTVRTYKPSFRRLADFAEWVNDMVGYGEGELEIDPAERNLDVMFKCY